RLLSSLGDGAGKASKVAARPKKKSTKSSPAFAPPPAAGGSEATAGERHLFTVDDLMGLMAAAPDGLDDDAVDSLVGVVRLCLHEAASDAVLLNRFRKEVGNPDGMLTARQVARLLDGAGRAAEMGEFLPTRENAAREKDVEALELLTK